MLNNGSKNPSRCSRIECFITGFSVEITPSADRIDLSIVDPCNQITECRMAKSILASAMIEYLEDNGLAIPSSGCSGEQCCDGVYGANFVTADNSAYLEVAGVTAGPTVTYDIVPPFTTVN